ncbi:MAG: CinA family protein [Candidatus Nanohaloarchaea archaeon]
MSILERFRDEQDESSAKKLADKLSSQDRTISVIEPASSGLVSYRLSHNQSTSKVFLEGVIPNSFESYQQFISLDEINSSFPHKQVSNDHDAQLLANNVREQTSADIGVSVLAPLDGTAGQTVFVGLNIDGRQIGVFKEEFDFRSQNVEKKISEFVIFNLLRELSR